MKTVLKNDFFACDAQDLAKALLGKVIQVRYRDSWLAAQIIETEAYYCAEKASHASLGYTEKRKALFMPPGTIYMYYARGAASFNISAQGEGNAVLIKSALPYLAAENAQDMIASMQHLNPQKNSQRPRPTETLCAGQTLLCRSLGLTVEEWDQQTFQPNKFCLVDVDYQVDKIVQTIRLGIPKGRDEHLPYRFIDYAYLDHCSQNPLRKRGWQLDQDYREIKI